ncbi:ORC1-type DNA replication protein [Candidatus Woesearchaeota archaeon]|nr:ORC1-type DNA replication protein [Candidatus Woesearchaeota archaeon]
MGEKELTKFFEEYLQTKPLFKNKKALQSQYMPKTIPHREKEIDKVAGILAPILRTERPSNLFIYGKTGTGKSLVVQHVTTTINEIAIKNKLPIKIFYLNCKLKRIADTEYRLVAQLSREFGQEVPTTGLPTDEIYKLFINQVEKEKLLLILVLDEIDQLVSKVGDEILYNLIRLNTELKKSEISIIGISNDLMFTNYLDPRVRSSLSEEELVFPPYNAIQLKEILEHRAKSAFNENVLEEGVIEKCSAYAAREHGDARRALELLRVAGEITERKGLEKVRIKDLDEAESKIERDRVLDVIQSQPKQSQIALYSILKSHSNVKEDAPIFTGDIYELYKELCFKTKIRPLTQRRISDIIAELDMLGIITAKVISKGRYGRTRQICLAIPDSTIIKVNDILKEGLNI